MTTIPTPIPKQCDALSNNGRDWYSASTVPPAAKYARICKKTTTGIKHEYLRRIRQQDIRLKTQRQWVPVTIKHIEHFARERVYG